MNFNPINVSFMAAVAAAACTTASMAQADSVFTYQGELQQNGSPANGNYDMSFSLWTNSAGGSQVGATQVKNGTSVDDGRFMVDLDFGSVVFDNDLRWLQIVVDGDTLAPRQAVNRSPYAITTRGIFVNSTETFVGVGRENPIGSEYFGVHAATSGATYGGMYISTISETGWPFYGYAAGQTGDMWTYLDGGTDTWHVYHGGQRLSVRSNGFVGVGRSNQITGAEWFGVDTPAGDHEYGGMYIDTEHPSGFPFYGYATNGSSNCWTWYHGGETDWHVYNNGNRLTVESTGHVGINHVNPGWELQVNGAAAKPGGGSWTNSSDIRLKKNIEDLDGALESLMMLRGVTFEYIDPEAISELPGQRIGVIAQEVEQVFPDWIDAHKDGYLGVTFRGFEALTIEALRELRDEKDTEIAQLEAENQDLHDRLAALEAAVAAMSSSSN